MERGKVKRGFSMVWQRIKNIWKRSYRLVDFAHLIPGINDKNLTRTDRIIIYIAHALIAVMFFLMWLTLVYR